MPKRYNKNIVCIAKGRANRSDIFRILQSNLDFFKTNEYYVFKYSNNCLTICKTGLDIPKNAKRASLKSPNWHTFTLQMDILPIGHFQIDEDESNEDCIVIYF